jgi:hypothetical protein
MSKTALVLATVATLGLSTAAFANTGPATKERVQPTHTRTMVTHKKHPGYWVRGHWVAGHWYRGHWFARHWVRGHRVA